MNAGMDPFTDEDPMIIYQNILRGKIKFPRDMNIDAKAFILKLLVADPSKRFGIIKNGVEDVKEHRWFSNSKIDMKQLLSKKINMSYKPVVKFPGDTSNFSPYPDSDHLPPALKTNEDPFVEWWFTCRIISYTTMISNILIQTFKLHIIFKYKKYIMKVLFFMVFSTLVPLFLTAITKNIPQTCLCDVSDGCDF